MGVKQAYISDGISENIRLALSKTPKLFVIARNSIFVYKDDPVNIKQAAEELGVRYIKDIDIAKRIHREAIALDPKYTAAYIWDDFAESSGFNQEIHRRYKRIAPQIGAAQSSVLSLVRVASNFCAISAGIGAARRSFKSACVIKASKGEASWVCNLKSKL